MVPEGSFLRRAGRVIFLSWLAVSILFGICITGASAQIQPVEEWNRTFGGPLSEGCRNVKQTADGGYILIGFTNSFTSGDSDLWVVKTDPHGNLTWAKNFGGTGEDTGHYVIETPDHGFVLAGTTRSSGSGDYDAWLIKTDQTGKEIWEKTYGGIRPDAIRQVIPANDGGYLAVGSTVSSGNGRHDLWLIRTDVNGNKTWDKTFGGLNDDEGWRVTRTPDNGYIIIGYTESGGNGGKDIWLIKTDLYGNRIWDKKYGGSHDDYGRAVKNTDDGGFIASGYTDSFGSGDYDYWLIKTDANGNEEWNKTFGGSFDDLNRPVSATDDGGYVMGGWTGSKGAGGFDGWIVKTDPAGTRQWDMTFGGPKDDKIDAMNQTPDGGFIACGSTESFSAGETDMWLIRIGLQGKIPDTSMAKADTSVRTPASLQPASPAPVPTRASVPFSLHIISLGIACSVFLYIRKCHATIPG